MEAGRGGDSFYPLHGQKKPSFLSYDLMEVIDYFIIKLSAISFPRLTSENLSKLWESLVWFQKYLELLTTERFLKPFVPIAILYVICVYL